jgi:hypothetical protein
MLAIFTGGQLLAMNCRQKSLKRQMEGQTADSLASDSERQRAIFPHSGN